MHMCEWMCGDIHKHVHIVCEWMCTSMYVNACEWTYKRMYKHVWMYTSMHVIVCEWTCINTYEHHV